jgi:hypothetical protein
MSGAALFLLMLLLGAAVVAVWAWIFQALSREETDDVPGETPDPDAERALGLGAALWLRGARWDPAAFEAVRGRLRAAWVAGGRRRLVEYPEIHEDAVRAARALALGAYEGRIPPEQAAAWIRELGRALYGDPDGRHLWERAEEELPPRSPFHPQGPA